MKLGDGYDRVHYVILLLYIFEFFIIKGAGKVPERTLTALPKATPSVIKRSRCQRHPATL